MNFIGNLRKMAVSLANPVAYKLVLHDPTTASSEEINAMEIPLNEYLGKEIQLRYTGKINCIVCGRSIKKSYQQGYCFPCTQKLAQCDFCILQPVHCHYHLGTCREPSWGEQHCMQPHIVYLANTSGIKVGITRESQVPIRWIDQGAIQALPIMQVKSRYQSGLVEEAFSKLIGDKTNWRQMLQKDIPLVDLAAERDRLLPEVAGAIQKIATRFNFGDIEILTNAQPQAIEYPVLKYPAKITSLNFLKQPLITSTLHGIKGQYLIFAAGVINIRSYSGYEIEFGVA